MTESGTSDITHGLTRCDEAAWRLFHERYFTSLRARVIARGVPAGEAAEVVQGVYLRVLRHTRVFHDAAAFDAWLSCLARCGAIDHARKVKRRSWLGERFQQWQLSRDTSHRTEELEDALGTLEEHDRVLITRHYLDGWSQDELAREHGVSVKAVESKLARLRRRLRDDLVKSRTTI